MTYEAEEWKIRKLFLFPKSMDGNTMRFYKCRFTKAKGLRFKMIATQKKMKKNSKKEEESHD